MAPPHPARRLNETPSALKPHQVQSRRLARLRRGRPHELSLLHREAPRRLLPLRLEAHRLHVGQIPLRQRSRPPIPAKSAHSPKPSDVALADAPGRTLRPFPPYPHLTPLRRKGSPAAPRVSSGPPRRKNISGPARSWFPPTLRAAPGRPTAPASARRRRWSPIASSRSL